MSRRVAIIVLTFYAGLVAIAAATRAGAFAAVIHIGGHTRVTGTGQIRFDGAGPELWAFRFRRERRAANTLRRELAARLDRIVYLVDAFNCVHQGEGAWNANTGNGYYGGLQMDVGFQSTYGRDLLSAKGTADHWTPAQQIAVAIEAHATRGFWPWPNTARTCGLLP
jgi:hypothetical protein